MMAFTSQLYGNEPIIDDFTPDDQLFVPGTSRGLELARGVGPDDYAYKGVANPWPDSLNFPESDWEGMIKEAEERKTRLSDLMMQANLPEKDQDGIPYCWIFGPVQCVEVIRMLQNQEYVSLSPASAGAPIKNFQKQGGWGKEGLLYIVDHGLVPSEFWPDCAVDRKYWTEENKRRALNYRVTEWWELRPRNLKQMVSMGLRRTPGAGGFNYWQHEVMMVEPVWLDNTVAYRIRNQWKGYGDKNFAIVRGSKMLADDLVAPRVSMAA